MRRIGIQRCFDLLTLEEQAVLSIDKMNRSTLTFGVEVGDLWNSPWCGDQACVSLLHLIPSWSVMQRPKFHPCHCHSALTCRAANGFIQHGSNHGNVRVSNQKSVWQVGTKKLASFSQAIRYSLIWFDVPIQDRTWSSLEQRIWLPLKLKADMMQAGIWSGTCLDLGSTVYQIQSLQNPLLSFLTSNNCVIICCRLITIFCIWLGTAAGWDLQKLFFLFLNAKAFSDFHGNHYNNDKFLIVIQM